MSGASSLAPADVEGDAVGDGADIVDMVAGSDGVAPDVDRVEVDELPVDDGRQRLQLI